MKKHLTLLLALCASSTFAHSYQQENITIDHPWTRATPPGSKVGAGFLKIINTGKTEDQLLGAKIENVGYVSIHQTTVANNIAHMEEMKDGLPLKAGETSELKPGSYHLMWMKLEKPIAAGQSISGTLFFKKAGAIPVQFKAQEAGAQTQKSAADEHHHH